VSLPELLANEVTSFSQLLYLALITPIVHDFYNYDTEKEEFARLFAKFTQVTMGFAVQKWFHAMAMPCCCGSI
jgi:hypothetical protein